MKSMRWIVCVCAMASFSFAADKRDPKLVKPDVPKLMEQPNELMEIAQSAYADGNTQIALEKFRAAHKAYEMLEATNPVFAASSEFQPVRFRKAICETEIDRILLEEAEASSRTVAVTDTAELAKKRAERQAKAKQAKQLDTAETLSAKQGPVKDAAAAKAALTEAEKVKEADQKADKKAADEKKPVNVQAELDWVKDCLQIDRLSDAETSLLRVLKKNPTNPQALLLMAQLRLRQNRFEDALVVVEDILADAPDDEAALFLQSAAQLGLGAYTKAMTTLDHAIKVNPKRPDAYVNMAWLLLEMNPKGLTEAEPYYREAIKLGAARNRDLEKRLGINEK